MFALSFSFVIFSFSFDRTDVHGCRSSIINLVCRLSDSKLGSLRSLPNVLVDEVLLDVVSNLRVSAQRVAVHKDALLKLWRCYMR